MIRNKKIIDRTRSPRMKGSRKKLNAIEAEIRTVVLWRRRIKYAALIGGVIVIGAVTALVW